VDINQKVASPGEKVALPESSTYDLIGALALVTAANSLNRNRETRILYCLDLTWSRSGRISSREA
jgi:hypothetical protein